MSLITKEVIWKDILGYEGYYQANNIGQIKSISRIIIRTNGKKQTIKEIILKQSKSTPSFKWFLMLITITFSMISNLGF